MTLRSLTFAIPLLLSACALSSDDPSLDNGVEHGGPNNPVEPVAPADPAKLTVTRAGTTTPLTQWQAGDVSIGQHASIAATVTNTGGTAANNFHITITGANANQFSVDSTSSDCLFTTALPAGSSCGLTLVFSPTGTPGTLAAQINIFGAPTLAQIGMRGNAVEPTNSITTDVTAIDFGSVDIGDIAYRNVVVSNTGTAAVSISAPTVRPGVDAFEVIAYDCGATLAGGASCAITVRYAPDAHGALNSQLTIATASNTPIIPLTGTGTRLLTVTWTGNGQITAVPNNLTCAGTTCTGHFPGAIAVTAVPLAGSSFVAWTPVCGVNQTCTLPADDTAALTLNATFSP